MSALNPGMIFEMPSRMDCGIVMMRASIDAESIGKDLSSTGTVAADAEADDALGP
jgi:hypothetical protein